ncbi:MAG TPA: hypothetical protein PLN34_02870 [Alloprevotella sp.]|nr:hypothetical protein [Alloprevotella sp.]
MKKKKLFLPLIFATGLLTVSCGNSSRPASDTASADTVVTPGTDNTDPLTLFLEDNIGQYPRDAGLFEDATFRKRLKALVGEENYLFVQKNFQTQTPIDYGRDYGKPDYIIMQGFETHNAGFNDISIAYNPATGNLMAKIIKEGSKPMRFQELNESFPF